MIQRFVLAVVPAKWADSVKAESMSWMVRCPCGFSLSVWDMGGIRWKASGRPKRYALCRGCGEKTWHAIYYHDPKK